MSVPYEKAVGEDLNLGHGSVTVTNPNGGTLTGSKVGLHTLYGSDAYLCGHDFSGNDWVAKAAAAHTALPAAGGVIDLRGIPGGTATSTLTLTKAVRVIFGVGTYWGTIIINGNNTTIEGQGIGATVLKKPNNTNASTINIYGTGTPVVTVSNIVVKGLTIDGNKANQTVENAEVFFKFVTNGLMCDCEVQNSYALGIGCGDGSQTGPTSRNVKILNNWIHDCRGNGIDVNNAINPEIRGNHSYSNGTIPTLQAMGIFVGENEGSGAIIEGNHAYSNAGTGIGFNLNTPTDSVPNTRVVIAANQSYSNGLNGIGISGASAFGALTAPVTIVGNLVHSNGADTSVSAVNRCGIYVDYCNDGICVGNVANNAPSVTTQQYGLLIANSSRWFIANNQLLSNSTAEVSIANLATHHISGNGTQVDRNERHFVLANTKGIHSRNNADTLDLEILRLDTSDQTIIAGDSSAANSNLLFYANGTLQMRIDGDGSDANRVLPGTTGKSFGKATGQWRVFNEVVATGSLPAAGADMNGALIIEDAGAGDRNIIIYAGGQRFRIDGGAPF